MPLTSGAADTLATTFCSSQGIVDATAIAKWKALAEQVYTSLKTDATVTVGIPVATTGSAASQVGATTAPGTLT